MPAMPRGGRRTVRQLQGPALEPSQRPQGASAGRNPVAAGELIRKWGAGAAVNALARALTTCTLDVADGTRVLQMRRSVQ